MNKSIFCALGCVCLSWSSGALSLSEGRADWKWLLLPTDAHSASLSNGGVASDADQGQYLFMPAIQIDKPTMVLNHQILPEEVGGKVQNLQVAYPLGAFAYLGGVRQVTFDSFEGKDENALSTGEFDVAAWEVHSGLAYHLDSLKWGNSLRVGAQLFYGQYHIENGISRAIWMDFEAQWSLNSSWGLGLQFKQIGGGSGFYERELHLPSSVALGAIYKSTWGMHQVNLLTDYKYTNDRGSSFPVGLEWGLNQFVFARASHVFDLNADDENALGLGIAWNWLKFDYAYQINSEMSGRQTLSLGLSF